jgi:hypothetical protein
MPLTRLIGSEKPCSCTLRCASSMISPRPQPCRFIHTPCMVLFLSNLRQGVFLLLARAAPVPLKGGHLVG